MLGIFLEACSSVHLVRNVVLNKEMLYITFQIPAAILYKNEIVNQDNHKDPPFKCTNCFSHLIGNSFSISPLDLCDRELLNTFILPSLASHTYSMVLFSMHCLNDHQHKPSYVMSPQRYYYFILDYILHIIVLYL